MGHLMHRRHLGRECLLDHLSLWYVYICPVKKRESHCGRTLNHKLLEIMWLDTGIAFKLWTVAVWTAHNIWQTPKLTITWCVEFFYEPFVKICINLSGLTCTVKPWPNRLASSRKWTHVELAQRLALGGQRAHNFLHKYTQVVKKRHFKADYPLFYWLIIC